MEQMTIITIFCIIIEFGNHIVHGTKQGTYSHIFARNRIYQVVKQIYFLKIDIRTLYVMEECGSTKVHNDGNVTFEAEHPWVVAIFRDEKYACGGILISSLTIVTSAYCVMVSRFPRYVQNRYVL